MVADAIAGRAMLLPLDPTDPGSVSLGLSPVLQLSHLFPHTWKTEQSRSCVKTPWTYEEGRRLPHPILLPPPPEAL